MMFLNRLQRSQLTFQDAHEQEAVRIVKAWVGVALGGKMMLDEDDAPIIQLNGRTCSEMSRDIAAALRRASRGEMY